MIATLANFRILVVCLMAMSVALPIALISLAKLLLLLCALALLLFERRRPVSSSVPGRTWSPAIILGALLAMALSLLWSSGPGTEPFVALAKHGKLVLVALLLFLLRSRREALLALAAFGVGQLFLLGSTGLLLLGATLPWARANLEPSSHAVFSSYLDQSMMSATFGAVCWHLRGLLPGRHGRLVASGVAALALLCVFFVFQARTGHLIAIAVISLAILWQLPGRFRAAAALVPLVVALLFTAGSATVRDRLHAAADEVQAFSQSGDVTTSSGIRLNLWRRSVQSVAQRPWAGSGVGSWYHEFDKLQKRNAPGVWVDFHGNPHQEFLLWSVELGLPGAALLCAVLTGFCRDGAMGDSATSRATLSVVAALLIACLFNCALYDALIGDFFCVVIGLLLALAAHPGAMASMLAPAPATASS